MQQNIPTIIETDSTSQMKKINIIILLLALAGTLVYAQKPSGMELKVIKSLDLPCGTVHYIDGHEETYARVGITCFAVPYCPTCVSYEKDLTKDNVEMIDESSIEYVTFWREEFPDKKTTLYRIPYEWRSRKKSGIGYCWGIAVCGSSWGIVYMEAPFPGGFEIKKDGSWTTFVAVDRYGAASKMIINQNLYLFRTNDESAKLIGFERQINKREKKISSEMQWLKKKPAEIADYFKENKAVYEQILSGKLTAEDLQYILDQMALPHE